jgi:hypothetical protein
LKNSTRDSSAAGPSSLYDRGGRAAMGGASPWMNGRRARPRVGRVGTSVSRFMTGRHRGASPAGVSTPPMHKGPRPEINERGRRVLPSPCEPCGEGPGVAGPGGHGAARRSCVDSAPGGR